MLHRGTIEPSPGALSLVKSQSDDIEIQQYCDAVGAMGNGVLLHDQPGEIHSWRVTQEWITKNVKSHTGIANLCIVTGFGDSMKPLFNPGDPLIVDIGVKAVEFDAVFLSGSAMKASSSVCSAPPAKRYGFCRPTRTMKHGPSSRTWILNCSAGC